MIPVFDAHADTLSALFAREGNWLENNGHYDLRRSGVHAPSAQFFAVYGIDFEILYPYFQCITTTHRDVVAACVTGFEAHQAAKENKLAAFLSLEGGEVVGCDEDRLEEAWKCGARMVGLTWNHDNKLAGGAGGAGGGLTEAGVSFLRKARTLSMIVDVSHLSDASFWDVAEAMEGTPFVASHSDARSVCTHRRNLTDEQFCALVQANGFVGINLYTPFLTDKPQAHLEDVENHIAHFASLGGLRHIGLGCDFDGCEDLPAEIHGTQDLDLLYEWLLRKNYREDWVRGIFYHNLMRVVEMVCDT
jgi:membrane dipeptidase